MAHPVRVMAGSYEAQQPAVRQPHLISAAFIHYDLAGGDVVPGFSLPVAEIF